MQHEQGGMTVVEFIGFIVSLFAMLFLLLKQFLDEMKKKRDPKGYAEKQRKREQALKEMMGDWGGVPQKSKRIEEEEFDEEEEDEVAPISPHKPPPFAMPPQVSSQPHAKQLLKPIPAGAAGSRQGNNLTSDYFTERHGSFEYEVQRLNQESRGAALVNQFPTRKELFIIKEILDKPIALRDEV